ncbi:MAG: hypothetical protein ACTIJ6_05510 [Leucobacter sp.]
MEDMPWFVALPVAVAVLVKVGREYRWVPRLLIWAGVKDEEMVEN